MKSLFPLLCLGLLLNSAAYEVALAGPDSQPGRVMLPQDHDYQRVLRTYMATLNEQDFEHGVTTNVTVATPSDDMEEQFRAYTLSLMLAPLVGLKRGIPSISSPAKLYTLAAIEGPGAVMAPPCAADALISFVRWNYPGNPYHDNRALKLRAFVTGAVHLMMLDNYLTANPTHGRADWYGYEMVNWGAGYAGFKDLLPPDVQQAYVMGLRRMAERVLEWGPRGEEPNLEMITPVGLWYVAQAVNDPAFSAKVEAHARMLYTDPKYFHPAGYWVERGGIDTGFGGQASVFAVWGALASGWEFARESIEQIYRLRAHLDLPEPDGAHTGPSAFNARLGTPVFDDQWGNQGVRDFGAAMLTDEAAYLYPLPPPEALAEGVAKRATFCAFMIPDNPVGKYKNAEGLSVTRRMENHEIHSSPWRRLMWQNWQFPLSLNATYDHYRDGAYAYRMALMQADSPMLKSPFLRGETFVRDFAKAFFVTRQPSYAAILHTGPVSRQRPDDGLFQFSGPMGFGGGQLSAFWTPETGAVLLTRRIAMHWDKNFDAPEEWRNLPVHAVSGVTADGQTFTSGRIADPVVTSAIDGMVTTVTAQGAISIDPRANTEVVEGTIGFSRTFGISRDALRVETTITATGQEMVTELYETLPVFHREGGRIQGPEVGAVIEFQTAGRWLPATDASQVMVTAIRISRFSGAVLIAFDDPQTVKLSPKEWADTYLSRAVCRNLLIDLLGDDGQPEILTGEKRLSYTIQALSR